MILILSLLQSDENIKNGGLYICWISENSFRPIANSFQRKFSLAKPSVALDWKVTKPLSGLYEKTLTCSSSSAICSLLTSSMNSLKWIFSFFSLLYIIFFRITTFWWIWTNLNLKNKFRLKFLIICCDSKGYIFRKSL